MMPNYEVYYGSSHIADSAYKYPDDSISERSQYSLQCVGTFSRAGKPMLFIAAQVYRSAYHSYDI